MKKVSLKNLESDGWNISGDDRNNIADRQSKIADSKTLRLIADSMEGIKASINKVALSSESDQIEKLLNTHFELIKQLFEQLEAKSFDYRFDVKRKDGQIDQVFARHIDG
jgi:hypothetical protein